jgi:hypothetical protein
MPVPAYWLCTADVLDWGKEKMSRTRSLFAVVVGVALVVPLAGTAAADGPPTALWGTVTARFTGQPVPG